MSQLETFANPHPGRDYLVEFRCPEFTCVCPKTGQPDFATLEFRYVPDRLCVELKSLKMFLWSFREKGAFHEDITNQIAEQMIDLLKPRFFEVVGDFNVRGGIYTKVRVRHGEEPALWRRGG